MVRRFVLLWFTCRDRSRPSGCAWARELGISHTLLQKVVKELRADPGKMRELQAYGDPRLAELIRAKESSQDDSPILQLAGKHGWAILTHDTKNRYRGLERKRILLYRVRQFIFTANLGGHALAQLLVSVCPKMRKFARENDRPFVAVITKSGDIYPRMNSQGKCP